MSAKATGKVAGIVDAEQRARALDVSQGFVVQAPAGSGKTGLLVQRFLALLAGVQRPEAVLAITFTRKAAGEMRRRILEALRDAKTRKDPPEADFERDRHELACRVLERDAELDWGLLDSPSRLQVFTIDSFCSRVVSATPLLSRLGSTPGLAQNPAALYREAVRRTFSSSGRALLGEPLEVLLERYEMGMDRLENQLVEMLEHRDQWGKGAVESRKDEDAWAAEVEARFGEAIAEETQLIVDGADPQMMASVHAMAQRSRAAVGDDCAWPTLGDTDRLDGGEGAARAWKQAETMLRKNGTLRKRGSHNQDIHGEDLQLRDDLRDLLDELNAWPEEKAEDLDRRFSDASKVPAAATFSEDGRRALSAFLAVLRQAYVALWDVFRERGEVDYVEIAMRAAAALGHEDVLEKLDARIDHILVDEFQDTNVLQCDLLRGLTSGWVPGDGRTLFLVGDPMQSIYRFRKAEVGLFLAARSQPNFLENCRLTALTLSVNFRSSTSVVDWVNAAFAVLLGDRNDAARSLVAFAPASARPDADEGVPTELVLWTTAASADGLPVTTAQADEAEATGLADWIAEAAREERARAETNAEQPVNKKTGHRPAPIAVLVRARRHALPLLRALENSDRKVRVRAPGMDMLADRGCITDLEALTRALMHPGDRVSWLALLRSPWIGLTVGDLAALVEPDVAYSSRDRRPTPLPLLMRSAEALERVSSDGQQRIARLVAIMDAARRDLASRNVDIVVRSAWLRLGGGAADPEGARLAALDAEAFFDLLVARSQSGRIDLDDLSRALESTEAPVDQDADVDVEIMTMHKAKGLEFDTVILPALNRISGSSGALPLAMETDATSGRLSMVAPCSARGREDTDADKFDFLAHREERRGQAETLRMLYVAATRAKRRLLLSAAQGRMNKGGGPASGTLLKALLPADVMTTARQILVASQEATGAFVPVRLPADFALATALPSIADVSVVSVSPSLLPEMAPAFFADGTLAANVGTTYHALAERIANEGLEAWPVERVSKERATIARTLRGNGVLASEMEEAVERVVAALTATLEDEKGRWILSANEEARSEWAVLSYQDRRITSAVVDRTFVADGVRWIVDFKTGRSDGDAQGVDEKRRQYVPQLARYRELLGSHGGNAMPIRLALYFPEWPAGQRWQDITELVDAAEEAAVLAAAAREANLGVA